LETVAVNICSKIDTDKNDNVLIILEFFMI